MKLLYKDNKEYYEFLIKYLSIQSAELFFTDKVIFIEGISEKILIRYFMKKHDEENEKLIKLEKEMSEKENREMNGDIVQLQNQLLLNQNISILEVGANAKVFQPFFEFLNIKVLIITDIDSVKLENVNGNNRWHACSVDEGESTSNATIKNLLEYDKLNKI